MTIFDSTRSFFHSQLNQNTLLGLGWILGNHCFNPLETTFRQFTLSEQHWQKLGTLHAVQHIYVNYPFVRQTNTTWNFFQLNYNIFLLFWWIIISLTSNHPVTPHSQLIHSHSFWKALNILSKVRYFMWKGNL